MTCCGMNLNLNEFERVTLMKGHVERVQAKSAYAPVHYKGSVQEDAQVRLGSVQNVNVSLIQQDLRCNFTNQQNTKKTTKVSLRHPATKHTSTSKLHGR